jgi:hypothetical protein
MSEKKAAAARLVEMVENIEQQSLEESRVFIENFSEQIAEPLVKVPEPVFREIFLPYFTGQKKADLDHNAVAHWSGLVGSATSPAEVVNVKGETLFVVPPLFDSDLLNVQKNDRTSFATIFIEASEESRVHKAAGRAVISKGLSEKLENALGGEGSGYSWDPVLNYYGVQSKEQATATKQTRAAQHVTEDFDFDEGD